MNLNAATYRDIGDVPFQVWSIELDRYPSSPLIPIAPALYAICKGHTALALAHLKRESEFETDRDLIQASDGNPFNLRPNDLFPPPPGSTGEKEGYLTFESPLFCAREWRRRVIDDPTYRRVDADGNVFRYTPTMSLSDYLGTYALVGDAHKTTGDANETYADDIVKMLTRFAAEERELTKEPDMTDKITFGRVPHPEYQNHLYVSEKKIEGIGWDNLGKRKPKFIALHRMYGTLAGTLSYFTPPTAPHLTDYAIGVEAIDGKKGAGIIHKYNDPTGFRSGWASGRVSAPYGDGKAIVDNYGINAVNRDGVSIELSGYWDTPVDAYSWSEYVKLIAHWVDFMRIPYDSLPLNPHTGINTFIWHQEFTIGTGKVCPGSWLMNNTSRLYKDVAAYLKPFQTGQAGDGTGGGETPKPVPVPTPIYAKPAPVAVLVAVTDKEATAGISDGEGNHYTLVNDLVEATRDTPRLQSDEPNAPSTGPVIKAKERFPVTYLKVNARGEHWYVTDWWTFLPVSHTRRISDAKAAA